VGRLAHDRVSLSSSTASNSHADDDDDQASDESIGNATCGFRAAFLGELDASGCCRRRGLESTLTMVGAPCIPGDALAASRLPVCGLRDRVWALRKSLSAYDATYVAPAGYLQCALVIADARLSNAADCGALSPRFPDEGNRPRLRRGRARGRPCVRYRVCLRGAPVTGPVRIWWASPKNTPARPDPGWGPAGRVASL